MYLTSFGVPEAMRTSALVLYLLKHHRGPLDILRMDFDDLEPVKPFPRFDRSHNFWSHGKLQSNFAVPAWKQEMARASVDIGGDVDSIAVAWPINLSDLHYSDLLSTCLPFWVTFFRGKQGLFCSFDRQGLVPWSCWRFSRTSIWRTWRFVPT